MTADNKTLATFRVDEARWTAFKEKTRMAGANASEVLNGFVEAYLAGTVELPGHVGVNPTSPSDMSSRLESIEQRLASLESIQSGELVA